MDPGNEGNLDTAKVLSDPRISFVEVENESVEGINNPYNTIAFHCIEIIIWRQ